MGDDGAKVGKDNEHPFWLSKTCKERLEEIERLRQVVYGRVETEARVKRILEITTIDQL